jgi:ferredoxin, 2Fe-2S
MKPTFTVGSLKPTARPPMPAASATSSKPNVPLAASSVIQVEQKRKRFVVQPASGVSLLDAAPLARHST